jgi:hypothetical protein
MFKREDVAEKNGVLIFSRRGYARSFGFLQLATNIRSGQEACDLEIDTL